MKVLMFTPYYPPVPGGQENLAFEITNYLKKSGHDVELLTRYKHANSKWETAWFYLKCLPKLFSYDVDMISGHDVQVGTVLLAFKYLSRKPSALSIESSVFLETYRKYPWFYRRMLEKQDAIIAISKELQSSCQELTKKKIWYVPNGVDTDKFVPKSSDRVQQEFGIPPEANVLITVRRLDRKNNVIELAKAFDLLSKRRKDVYLVVIGDGEQRPLIEALKNPKIILAGFKPNAEIPEYLNSADVFVIPSLYEATSISCLEAEACGLPVVSSNVGGLPEIVRDNGVLCQPNAESLAAAIEKILEQDLTVLGKNSRKIAEEYSWYEIIKKYIEVYEGVLK